MTYSKNTTPAILGGSPSVTASQETANAWPVFNENDEEAVVRILRDGNVSTHPVIRELEADYAEFTGMPFSLAHNNGTAALLAAFFALDLEPGDEIIVPTATFWASASPMLWNGLIPVFCESEPERLGPDPEDIERKITERTKAIVVVHLWGMPCKMSEILAIAKKHNLKIIEDASHAHGATWRGKPCGSLGDIGIFSLQGDKLAPAGEGGIFLCREETYFERAVCLGDITRIIELPSPQRRFAATSFGIKTRISSMSAALGKEQLKRLPENNQKRNENLIYLSQKLEKLGFDTFLAPEHIERVYFEYLIRYDSEKIPLSQETLVAALQAEGCLVAAPRYPLVHQQPFYTEGHAQKIARLPAEIVPPVYDPQTLHQTYIGNETLIQLPSFPNASIELLDQYVEAFEKVINSASSLSEATLKSETV